MHMVRSDVFDLREIWRLKGDDTNVDGMPKESHFGWQNLETLQNGLSKCWDESQGVDIFKKIPISFEKIFKDKDLTTIHELITVVFTTIILYMGSNQTADTMVESMMLINNGEFIDKCGKILEKCSPNLLRSKISITPYKDDYEMIHRSSNLSAPDFGDLFTRSQILPGSSSINQSAEKPQSDILLLDRIDRYEKDLKDLRSTTESQRQEISKLTEEKWDMLHKQKMLEEENLKIKFQ
jgi:hypothetical protein